MVGAPRPGRGLDGRLQLAVDEGELLPVRLAVIAIFGALRHVGIEKRVGAQTVLQLGEVSIAFVLGDRDAQMTAHAIEGSQVETKRHGLVLAQRVFRGRRIDIRIAVAIAADPAAEAQEVRHVEGRLRKRLLQRLSQAPLHLGGEIEECRLEVVKAVQHFVQNTGLIGAGFLGLPQGRQFLAQSQNGRRCLVRRRRSEIELVQKARRGDGTW
jgi:hypothetical protein